MVTIIDATVEDYPRLAALLAATRQQPIGVAQIERLAQRGAVVWRPRVAMGEDGRLQGTALLSQSASDGTGRYSLHISVEPSHQRQGIGTTLYDDALTFARANGLESLYSYVFEHWAGGIAFAQKLGFAKMRQAFHSRLDVAGFKARPFLHHITQNEATGIQFTTLAALGDTPENRRLLYELNKTCSADIPGRGTFFTFAEYEKVRFENPAYRPAGVILALDDATWVGMSAATLHGNENFVFNEMTGVIRPYRGRGIALALKLLVVRFARAVGAESIRTFNDAQNAPMLGVNERLGYVRQPSSFTMEQKFTT